MGSSLHDATFNLTNHHQLQRDNEMESRHRFQNVTNLVITTSVIITLQLKRTHTGTELIKSLFRFIIREEQ